jgi:hypothetical protein
MKEEVKALTEKVGIETPIEEKYILELLRFGNAKLHNVSAFLGGLAA